MNDLQLGAAGAGRQHALGRLVGASGRPVNFTLRWHRHMEGALADDRAADIGAISPPLVV